MKKMTITYLLAFVVVLGLLGCRVISGVQTPSGSSMTARELYKKYLNLDVPDTIRDLEVDDGQATAVFATRVYMRYRADEAYFEQLLGHKSFIQTSEFNEPFYRVPCDSSELPQNYRYWTNEDVSLEGKECLIGVFFPYVHYLIYDPQNQAVKHFVTGMRG